MSILEQEKKLESLTKARVAFLTEVKQEYILSTKDDNDGLDEIEYMVLSDASFLEWFEQRDLTYIYDMIDCQEALLKELLNNK